MHETKYLIIGGGLAGCEAIKGIRRHDTAGAITMVGDEHRLPYNRPPLSKAFLKGEKTEDDCLCEPAEFYRENNVKLYLGQRVVELNAADQSARLEDGRELTFGKALLATGGRALLPPLPGIDLPGVHALRTLDDAAAIREAAQNHRKAVIVGGGFIGMEISASLAGLGVEVVVIEAAGHLWPRVVDPEVAALVGNYYRERGVSILTGEKVARLEGDGRVSRATMQSGRQLACDFAICAVGLKPNTELAEKAGLTVDNGVVVDAEMRTDSPHIFAAGDIANYPDPHFAKRRRVEHWGQAEYTGGLAGENMAGAEREYDLLTYFWSEGFDLHYEFAGEEGEYDQVVLRGQFPDDDFAALYLSGHRLRAFLSLNPKKSTQSALETMISSKTPLAGREQELRRPDGDLASLL